MIYLLNFALAHALARNSAISHRHLIVFHSTIPTFYRENRNTDVTIQGQVLPLVSETAFRGRNAPLLYNIELAQNGYCVSKVLIDSPVP